MGVHSFKLPLAQLSLVLVLKVRAHLETRHCHVRSDSFLEGTLPWWPILCVLMEYHGGSLNGTNEYLTLMSKCVTDSLVDNV